MGPAVLGRPRSGRVSESLGREGERGKERPGTREGLGPAGLCTRAPPRSGPRRARVGAWTRWCCVMQAPTAGLRSSLGAAAAA